MTTAHCSSDVVTKPFVVEDIVVTAAVVALHEVNANNVYHRTQLGVVGHCQVGCTLLAVAAVAAVVVVVVVVVFTEDSNHSGSTQHCDNGQRLGSDPSTL